MNTAAVVATAKALVRLLAALGTTDPAGMAQYMISAVTAA